MRAMAYTKASFASRRAKHTIGKTKPRTRGYSRTLRQTSNRVTATAAETWSVTLFVFRLRVSYHSFAKYTMSRKNDVNTPYRRNRSRQNEMTFVEIFRQFIYRTKITFSAVHGRCTWSVRVPNTAVYAAGTRQTRPGTQPVPDRVRTVYMHGRARAVRPSIRPSLRPVCKAVYVPCTRPCMVRPWPEHGRVHGRVLCTRPCLRPVYAAVYRVHARTCTCLWPVYTAVHGVYGAFQASQKLTTETCWTAIRQIQ